MKTPRSFPVMYSNRGTGFARIVYSVRSSMSLGKSIAVHSSPSSQLKMLIAPRPTSLST